MLFFQPSITLSTSNLDSSYWNSATVLEKSYLPYVKTVEEMFDNSTSLTYNSNGAGKIYVIEEGLRLDEEYEIFDFCPQIKEIIPIIIKIDNTYKYNPEIVLD